MLKKGRTKVNGSQVYYNAGNIESQLLDIVKNITISESSRQELRNDLQNWFNDEGKSNEEMKQAETRLVKLRRMEQNLQQLRLEEEITLADFKGHRIKIEAERARLQNVVDVISQRQHLIKADFEVALQLAAELDFLFEKGTFDEKRLLCETVFKRVYLKEGRVSEVELNAPFGLIASRGKGSGTVQTGWGRRIRTFVYGSRVRCPTARRFPSTH